MEIDRKFNDPKDPIVFIIVATIIIFAKKGVPIYILF